MKQRGYTDEQIAAVDETIAAWADAMTQAHFEAIREDEQRREHKAMEADPFCRINRRAEAERRREREGR